MSPNFEAKRIRFDLESEHQLCPYSNFVTHTCPIAITVRFLTKRYISEYSSSRDFLYTHSVKFDDIMTEMEILDTSGCKNAQCLYDHISWGNAFAIVYSICDKKSFIQARHLLETISVLKGPGMYPILLLGNKTDLAEHSRQVEVTEGQEMCVQYQCQFFEVSAADSCIGVSLAFQSLIKQVYPLLAIRNMPANRRKSSAGIAVSKMIGMVFGKNGKNSRNGKKKSLSI
ncbi:ras-related and estrogen-regulated growth inhibitor-like [Oppia nitens]|uniref:ras-related and estrogen-regulated growth inhibitor-like n=1 Tax=Oppia nitens TaxID=1686743 RepID=UPI0023DABAD0|nr:ras-related and estrogen-regulated growth inhibitor-like [Oppia nitens]